MNRPRLRFLPRALPAWQAIALRAPQADVRVEWAAAGHALDVTGNHTVAALDPFTIAMGRAAAPPAPGELRFLEGARTLGTLTLRPVPGSAGDGAIDLFEVTSGTQACISWTRAQWSHWLTRRALRRRARTSVVPLDPEVVDRISIFYLCPRPVVLVSVDDGTHGNLFPMDLIGPLAGGEFTLALRLKSDSIALIDRARRVVLADMPANALSAVQMLGNLPRGQRVDWDALPFASERSAMFSLRTPANALRVREMEIVDSRAVGSHRLFRARLMREEDKADGAQLFHTSGLYQHLRMRTGRAFAPAG